MNRITIPVIIHIILCLIYGNADKFDFKCHLCTKSPYRIVANYSDNEVTFEGCKPEKIFGIVRHGTRTPKTRIIDNMKQRLPEIINQIHRHTNYMHVDTCPVDRDLEALFSWKFNNENEGNTLLTREGEEEMFELAQRFKNRFPSLLKEKYSNRTFYFKYTASQRTEESTKFFVRGLFGTDASTDVWFPEAVKHDPILRFYKNCKKWKKEIKENPDTETVLNKYFAGESFLNTTKSVSEKLGINFTLSKDDIQLMYTTCCFETAFSKTEMSPWCGLFSLIDFETLEYSEDLRYYLFDGYGHKLNYMQACPLIQDLHSFMKSSDTYKSKFYFTHSGTLLKTLCHLKLYMDDFVLTDDLPEISFKRRLWRTSYIDTFGTNIVFVLYNCYGESKMLTLHQEKIIRMPWCQNTDLCPISMFEKVFHDSIYNCNFDQMCSLKN